MMRLVWLILLLFGLMGCLFDPTPPPEPEVVQTDIATLVAGMNLPADPLEVQWVESAMGTSTIDIGPTDYQLLAVMRFTPETIDLLKMEWGAPENTAYYVESEFLRDWFPDAVTESFTYEPEREQFRLNVPSYPARLLDMGSYRNGYLFIVGEYVVLHTNTA